MEEVGIRVYHMPSSPITIAIKKGLRWRCLRCYMVIGAKLCYFGMRLENRRFSDPTFYKKLRSKFAWLGRTFESCNQGRKAMSIIGEEN
jgi:hypothetical protein